MLFEQLVRDECLPAYPTCKGFNLQMVAFDVSSEAILAQIHFRTVVVVAGELKKFWKLHLKLNNYPVYVLFTHTKKESL